MSDENKKELVQIEKLELQDGEELLTFISKVSKAVRAKGVHMEAPLGLRGIFKNEVVFQDFNTGKIFKTTISRSSEGEIELGKNSVEVRQAFVPVSSQVTKCTKCEYVAKEEAEKECPDCKAEIKTEVQKSEDNSKFVTHEDEKESIWKGMFF